MTQATRAVRYTPIDGKIKARMDQQGVSSLAELSELTGISRITISGLVSGRVPYVKWYVADSVAKVLDCEITSLFEEIALAWQIVDD